MPCIRSYFLITLAVLTYRVRADLLGYVERPDNSYAYQIERVEPEGAITVYLVRMWSQTWRGTRWSHWLTLFVPQELSYRHRAVLFIGGGSNETGPPADPSAGHLALVQSLSRSGAVVAILRQVPNQPLFDGLIEDALIAHSFEQYLENAGDDWPLLLPMVKSAVRAMDTVQAMAEDKLGTHIEGFVVTGASKRGWTAWLTAAVDGRVRAIAPMVIDLLNVPSQLEHQVRSYSGYSQKISDYTRRNIPQKMNTEVGQQLLRIVDPFVYRDRLTMPKLILLGTNDPYWTVDSANSYFPQLPGAKHLFYEPNAGHRLGTGMTPTLLAFVKASLDGATLPRIGWRRSLDGTFSVSWEDADARATLWQAHSPNRDFRDSAWRARPLNGRGQCQVKIKAPEQGWVAYFVDIRFTTADGPPFGLSTQVTVLPKTMPFSPPSDGP